ncbi:MAG: DinB family protein [Bellilinea sp.]
MPSELENYLQRLEDLHNQIKDLITAVASDRLNWRPFEASREQQANSLAILVAHTCGAEHFWIGEVIGGNSPTRNRQAEFNTQASSPTDLFHLLQQTSNETREVLLALPPDAMNSTREVEAREVPVRWALLHVIDHTALHLGHMQMTYQLLTGGTPHPAPLWKQRLP